MSPITATIIAIAGILLAYGFWSVINTHNATNARRRRQRKSDRIILTRQQKKVYQEAIRYYKQGNLKTSARMLESLNMTREAINILEKGRHIHEAAALLMRIHRPNRAGIIYARHKMWKEAAECFKKANMPAEVAQCCKKTGDIATAVVYYLEAKDYENAAECFEELGKHREAARLFTKLGQHQKAIQQYKHLIDKNPQIESIDFSDSEINVIINYIASESMDTRLADVLVIKNRIVEVICRLIKKNRLEKAITIYMKSTADIGPALIEFDGFDKDDHLKLSEVFFKSGAYEYAGMVYERMELFEQAGDSFKLQEDFERAAYNYDRAKLSEKVTAMRIEIASRGPAAPKPTPEKEKSDNEADERFRIEKTTSDFRQIEDTAELDIEGKQAKLAIPLPNAAIRGLIMDSPAIKHEHQSPPPVSMSLDDDDEEGTEPLGLPQIPSPPNSHKTIDGEPVDGIDWTGFHEAKFMLDLSTEQQNKFKSYGSIKRYEDEETILDYKDAPAGIFFILEGQVSVYKLIDGVDLHVDTMKPGETIGKLWLFIDRPSNVRFIAQDSCSLFSIKRSDFMEVLDKDGTIARKLYKHFTTTLIEKLISTSNMDDNLEAS
ncbi:cyclic nucleotide-binding domain-containing protein [Pseudobacteriovorax antillogorgiicola]|uniref:Cyclic nucleotide-binding domain-containing protein n=1 Tax=Pseudobacteriovorax antillogorgiicola TaxID=1513793 RepID=A0A1Y6CKH8_9BACT|nr:cyclic nucleotide-binding domain-containing protein [Pseudobacteriovorax antillogorgiicola]TCS45655.1 cyclic nucleotide-binding protein [Pseudobacteriovorax antillogorgiicola]SMF72932.1 Cyclic nucleotide-binding domain-containing protein [Pseudobacteriovorax antillogorgiicola]